MNHLHHLFVAAALGLTCASLPAGSWFESGVYLDIDPGKNACSIRDDKGHLLRVVRSPSQKVVYFTDFQHNSPTRKFNDWKAFSDNVQVQGQLVDAQATFDSDPGQPTTVTITLPD